MHYHDNAIKEQEGRRLDDFYRKVERIRSDRLNKLIEMNSPYGARMPNWSYLAIDFAPRIPKLRCSILESFIQSELA